MNAAQGRGCRVEAVAFDSVPADLRNECDQFVSGYLIPGLLPSEGGPPWGKPGSRVRGTCCGFTDKDYGFMRLFAGPGAGNMEPEQVFFHRNDGPPEFDYSLLPSRDFVFEFTLAEDRGDRLAARDVQLVTSFADLGPGRKKGPAPGHPAAQRQPAELLAEAGRDECRRAAAT